MAKIILVQVPTPALPKTYGFWRFMMDLFLIGITCGIWLLWMIFKALRKG